MSTRIHWAGEDGHRSCTHGRTATHREVSAAEFLKLQNLCRICELAAQREQRKQIKSPKSLPAPQWPEPRPIEEAPKHTGLLAWFPGTDMWNEGWELVFLSDDGWSTGREGHQPTHFLPLPPKPEVRK